MDSLIGLAVACIGVFFTLGLCVAAIRRRQTGDSYLLYWRNPLSPQMRAFFGHGFFQGTPAEISRILFFALVTLIAALGVSG